MIQRLIGEDIRVKIELDPNLFTVNADPSTMEQVIMNLVVNARDAMPQGGELTISTDNVILTPDACRHIPDANSGEHICLSVADTGCGMDTETLQHIFEPFFTTKEPGAGTGLGLSVVYGILQQHNGWINVYSHCDVGSVFKVYLPIIHDKPQDTEENVKQIATSIQGKGERILVIEDDENVRNFTISALKKNGYNVYSAACGSEAESVYDEQNGEFELILSDVVLPDKTGIDLIKNFNRNNRDLKMLFVSGYMDEKSQWSVIQKIGFPFIQKPYELTDLLTTIKELISLTPEHQA